MTRTREIEKIEHAMDELESGNVPVPTQQAATIRLSDIEASIDRAAYVAVQYLQSVVLDPQAERRERMQAATIILRDGSGFLRSRSSGSSDDSIIF